MTDSFHPRELENMTGEEKLKERGFNLKKEKGHVESP